MKEVYCMGAIALIWGSTPEPPKIPSPQIQPGQKHVQVDHFAAAVECVVPIQQDVLPSRWRYPSNQRHGLGVAAGLALRQQVRQDGRVVVDDRVRDQPGALVADLNFDVGPPGQLLLSADLGDSRA